MWLLKYLWTRKHVIHMEALENEQTAGVKGTDLAKDFIN